MLSTFCLMASGHPLAKSASGTWLKGRSAMATPNDSSILKASGICCDYLYVHRSSMRRPHYRKERIVKNAALSIKSCNVPCAPKAFTGYRVSSKAIDYGGEFRFQLDTSSHIFISMKTHLGFFAVEYLKWKSSNFQNLLRRRV
ncbi:predicted protein [Sclerotinia sclerotiorum 1980 UF-70]|uniref:Uncharacterized protein n=1 Tax=Sclerotinia sclerotiorum (strain ATCC 18683 / 1980 / Ss-1) TaxID=665079 RepID=A7EBJ3_SCLS1|nr:predicted protein [Sclerotinia sclerotiorum 1980 UF-70]EDN99821.1 predicted protein [Sclerotinia sclerotiorum 1980 UF-70]